MGAECAAPLGKTRTPSVGVEPDRADVRCRNLPDKGRQGRCVEHGAESPRLGAGTAPGGRCREHPRPRHQAPPGRIHGQDRDGDRRRAAGEAPGHSHRPGDPGRGGHYRLDADISLARSVGDGRGVDQARLGRMPRREHRYPPAGRTPGAAALPLHPLGNQSDTAGGHVVEPAYANRIH